MSNVIGIFDEKRDDRTVAAGAEIRTDGLRSLFESWRSITFDLEKLRNYLDDLGSILETLADGPEKAHVGRLINEAKVRIQASLDRSIGTTAVVARSRRNHE